QISRRKSLRERSADILWGAGSLFLCLRKELSLSASVPAGRERRKLNTERIKPCAADESDHPAAQGFFKCIRLIWKAEVPGFRDREDALLKCLFFHPAEIPCTNGFPRGGKESELRRGLLFTKISPETGNTKNEEQKKTAETGNKRISKKEEIKNGRLVKT
ncbi:MAG: hypothetical protein IIU47_05065, partial [Lachnospiraceae bacterium]|nr:hypothetical protein [Lachnospiraceae bacterium]